MIELLLGIAPAVVLLLYILWADRRQPEPLNELLFALFLGGVSTFFSMCFSLPLKFAGLCLQSNETYFDAFCNSFFGAGIPEELAKLILLFLVARYSKFFDERLDGIVYAACIGLGFAGTENVLYLMNAGDALASTAIQRALLSVPGHFCFAVFMGYWFSRWWWDTKDRGTGPERQHGYLAMAFVVPVILHTGYDWICFSTGIISKGDENVAFIITFILFCICAVFHRVGRKRLLAHQAEDLQQSVAEKAEMHLGEYDPDKTYKVYSQKQIAWSSWFAGPFAGMLMMSKNCDVYQNLKGKNFVWAWGTIGTVVVMIFTTLVPKIPLIAFAWPVLMIILNKVVEKQHKGLIPDANLQGMTFKDCIGRMLLGFLFLLVTATTVVAPIKLHAEREAAKQEEAELYEYIQDMELAEHHDFLIAKADAGNAQAMCALAAECWQSDGEEQNAKAAEWIEKSLEASDTIHVEFWLNEMAYFYHANEQYQEAANLLQHSIAFFPDEANLHDSYGEMLYLLGRKDEALAEWNHVMELNPDFLDYVEGNETVLHRSLKDDGLI